jgi:prefoldin subunit 5
VDSKQYIEGRKSIDKLIEQLAKKQKDLEKAQKKVNDAWTAFYKR